MPAATQSRPSVAGTRAGVRLSAAIASRSREAWSVLGPAVVVPTPSNLRHPEKPMPVRSAESHRRPRARSRSERSDKSERNEERAAQGLDDGEAHPAAEARAVAREQTLDSHVELAAKESHDARVRKLREAVMRLRGALGDVGDAALSLARGELRAFGDRRPLRLRRARASTARARTP
jgi:hypothetical protein